MPLVRVRSGMAQGVRVALLFVAAILATGTGFPLFVMGYELVNHARAIAVQTVVTQAVLFGLCVAFGAWVTLQRVKA